MGSKPATGYRRRELELSCERSPIAGLRPRADGSLVRAFMRGEESQMVGLISTAYFIVNPQLT